ILFCILVFLIPESPRWMMMIGREEETLKILTKISNEEHARHLLADIKTSLQNDQLNAHQKLNYRDGNVRFILILGCMIAMLQQVTGVNVMMYYAPIVLKDVTGSAQEALFQTIWIGVIQLIGSIIGAMIMDKMGRLSLMRKGTIGSIIGLLLTSWALYSQATGYFALFGMLFFMIFYALSWGVGAWVLISEVFPEKIKGFGMGLAVSLMWIANFLISLLFPVINDNAWLQETFGGAFSMWIFVVFNLVCYVFISRYVPETKGVPLTEIERLAENKLREIQGKRRDVIA
ncbi:MFS transporter, partial [Salmonella enterica subsp. enterica]|uniref:MFS transporter n=1 Tax=Salmonella enterica TaxID=28901 RepID=UPI00112F428B